MDDESLRRRLMEPGTWTNKQIWPNNASPGQDSGRCNSYLPNVDTYNRLMYTLQVFIANGMYVVLDYQVSTLDIMCAGLLQCFLQL
jgi:hypothetical protein